MDPDVMQGSGNSSPRTPTSDEQISKFLTSPGKETNGNAARPPVPVAVVGMACRLPGECNTPSKLWDLLVEGRDTWKPRAPKDRFNWGAFNHPDLDFQGTFSIDGGHFNDYVDYTRFDSAFFGIPQPEAKVLDPQQRLLLEVSYECLENAGIPMEKVAGKNIGSFVAFSVADYGRMWEKDMEYTHNNHLPATGEAMYANRISYVYDLAGPSMAVDTGCSGSMVVLDVACKYLTSGAIDGCFIGGSHFNMIPDLYTRKPRLLSRSGRCHAFDSRADGFTRADGTSFLFLKRLDDAIRDKDPIRAVVRATNTNFDGRTPGVFMPSKEAQIANIRQAYARAGINDLSQTSYFECHGTGTATGDPIETEAIGTVFGPSRTSNDPLLLGSNKPNLGHSEAPSALSSIMKSAFTLETGVIPPTVNIAKLNPNLDLDAWKIKVVRELTPLPIKSIRRISINAFGYGGANAHTILEAAQNHTSESAFRYSHGWLANTSPQLDIDHSFRPYLMAVSANDNTSLQGMVACIQGHLASPETCVDRLDLAYTLGTRRSKLFVRGFSVLAENEPISNAFDSAAITSGQKGYVAPPRIGFVFTGQGAQRAQMGKHLIQSFPSVGATLERLDGYLQLLGEEVRPSWSIKDELLKPEESSLINDPRYAQTLTCAMQIAIINLLKLWGVSPVAVVGHSSGEIPAAYAAGLLTEKMTILVGFFRGFSITTSLSVDDKIWSDCGMMAVGLGQDAVASYLEQYRKDSELVVACDNSPESVTVSGDAGALKSLGEQLGEAKVFARMLKVPKAYHNPKYMASYSKVFKSELDAEDVFRHGNTLEPQANMFSTVNNMKLKLADVQSGEYWRLNMESPVLFRGAVEAMLAEPAEQRVQVLIEIGPSSTLKGPIRQIMQGAQLPPQDVPKYVPTMIGGSNSAQDLLRTAGTLFMMGHPVDLERVNGLEIVPNQYTAEVKYQVGKTVVDLPNYAWNRSRATWAEPRASRNHRFREYRRHEVLGARMADDNPSMPTWRNLLSLSNTKWLPHHRIHDDIVFPAAGFITMAAEAIRQHTKDASAAVQLRGVHVKSALVMNNSGDGVYMFLTLSRSNSTSRWYDFSICSESYTGDVPAEVHCTGQVAAADKKQHFPGSKDQKTNWSNVWSGRQWYKHFSRVGFNYTETFQVIDKVHVAEGQQKVKAVLRLPDESSQKSRYLVPPPVIDGAMQSLLAASAWGKPGSLSDLCLPSMFEEIYLGQAPADGSSLECVAHVDVGDRDANSGSIIGTAEARDSRGEVVLSIRRLICVRIESGSSKALDDATQAHKVVWKPDVSLLPYSQLPGQEVLSGDCKKVTLSQRTRTTPLSFMSDLLAHQDPGASYLQLPGSGDVAGEILEALGLTPQTKRFGAFTVALSGATADDNLRQTHEMLYSTVGVSFKGLNIDHDLADQGYADVTFDVLIAGSNDMDSQNKLENFTALLKPGGSIITTGGIHLGRALCQAGFIGTEVVTKAGGDGASIWVRPITTTAQPQLAKGLSSLISGALHGDLVPDLMETEDGILVFKGLRDPQALAAMSNDTMALLKSTASQTSKPVVWLSLNGQMQAEQPFSAMIAGLSRVLGREEAELRLITLDVDAGNSTSPDTLANLTLRILRQANSDASEDREYAVRNGIVYVNRVVPDTETFGRLHETELNTTPLKVSSSTSFKDIPGFYIDIAQPGLLQSLTWFEANDKEEKTIGDYDVEFDVMAVGVNFKDVAISMGLVPKADIGLEAAGIVTRVGPKVTRLQVGDRVAGAVLGGYRSRVRTWEHVCFRVGDEMSYDEAATMPIVFYTTIIAIIKLGQLKRGQSILIHSAAGGVGIAAIQLAQHIGAEIYATVGSDEKRDFLIERMGIAPDRIFNSRTAEFREYIMRATDNHGVDYVLNSLTGDLLEESWNCLCENGCMLELGKVDFNKRHRLQMQNFATATSLIAVDTKLFMPHKDKADEIIKIFESLLEKKAIRPIRPIKTYNIDELEAAFRFMQSGTSLGKLVVRRQISDGQDVTLRPVPAALRFSADVSYLLIGCLGGIGRSITRWMFSRGARIFVMLSPSGDSKPQAKALVDDLRLSGATVVVIKGDCARMSDVEYAVNSAPKPVAGMLHSAMFLHDAPFTSLSPADFTKVTSVKVQGAFNLHQASLRLDRPLDFFIMLSSVSGVFGQHGQANYASANTFLDALATHRRTRGLNADAIALGFVEDIGWSTENEELEAKMAAMGILSVRVKETEILRLLEVTIQRNTATKDILSVAATPPPTAAQTEDTLDPAELTVEVPGQTIFGLTSTGQKPWKTFSAVRFRALMNVAGVEMGQSAGATGAEGELIAALRASTTSPVDKDSLAPKVVAALAQKISEFLLVPVEEIDAQRSPESLGIDSLVAVELRTWFKDGFGASVSTMDILKAKSFRALGEKTAEKMVEKLGAK